MQSLKVHTQRSHAGLVALANMLLQRSLIFNLMLLFFPYKTLNAFFYKCIEKRKKNKFCKTFQRISKMYLSLFTVTHNKQQAGLLVSNFILLVYSEKKHAQLKIYGNCFLPTATRSTASRFRQEKTCGGKNVILQSGWKIGEWDESENYQEHFETE